MKAVFRRELQSLFSSLTGYIIAFLSPAVFAVSTYNYVIVSKASDYTYVQANSFIALLPIIPIYAALGFSKDRRMGTDMLLQSLPLNARSITLGKYFAMCIPMLLGALTTCIFPAVLSAYISIPFLQYISGLVMYILAGAAATALGLLLSRCSKSAVCNALIGAAAAAFLYFERPIFAWIAASKAATLFCSVLIAGVVLWFARKTTGSWTAALAAALVTEGIGLLFLRGNSSAIAKMLSAVERLVNPFSRVTSYQLGLLSIADILYFLLAALFLSGITLVLSAFPSAKKGGLAK